MDSPRSRIEKPTATQALNRKIKKSAKNHKVTKHKGSILSMLVGAALIAVGLADPSGISATVSNALLTTGVIAAGSGAASVPLKAFFDKFVTKFRPGRFLQASNLLRSVLIGAGITVTGVGLTIFPPALIAAPFLFGANYIVSQLNQSAYENKKLQYDNRIKSLNSRTNYLKSQLSPSQLRMLDDDGLGKGKKQPFKKESELLGMSFSAGSTIVSVLSRFIQSPILSPLSSALSAPGLFFDIAHDVLMKKGAKNNLEKSQSDFLRVHSVLDNNRFNIVTAMVRDIATNLTRKKGFNNNSQNRNVLFYTVKALLESGLTTQELEERQQDIMKNMTSVLRPLMHGKGNQFDRHAIRALSISLGIDSGKNSILDVMPFLEKKVNEAVVQKVQPEIYKKADKVANEIVREFNIDVVGSRDKRLFLFQMKKLVYQSLAQNQDNINNPEFVKSLKEKIAEKLPDYLELRFVNDKTVPSKEKLINRFAAEDKRNATNEALIVRAFSEIENEVLSFRVRNPEPQEQKSKVLNTQKAQFDVNSLGRIDLDKIKKDWEKQHGKDKGQNIPLKTGHNISHASSINAHNHRPVSVR